VAPPVIWNGDVKPGLTGAGQGEGYVAGLELSLDSDSKGVDRTVVFREAAILRCVIWRSRPCEGLAPSVAIRARKFFPGKESQIPRGSLSFIPAVYQKPG
jgi:hypothetical protein